MLSTDTEACFSRLIHYSPTITVTNNLDMIQQHSESLAKISILFEFAMANDDFSGDDEEMGMSDMIPSEVRTVLTPIRKLKSAIRGRGKGKQSKKNGEHRGGSNTHGGDNGDSDGSVKKKKMKSHRHSARAR